MMNYMSNTAYGCQLYKENEIIKINMNALTYVKRLCLMHLFTYKGYIQACQKTLDFKYKIPLYLNDRLQLIPVKSIRDYDNVWVNYAYIKSYNEDLGGLHVLFYDGATITLPISKKTLIGQINRLNAIREVKIKHFHS